MLYAAVRPLATIGLKYYFRRIDLANADRIPDNAAVILAANHPTTFIEPCILACFLETPLNFMARGDFFKNPIADKLLRGVHIIPVFRLRDGGFSGLKNNYESFGKAFQVLAQKKTLMILAEGRCIHEKRLRPIRKGTARIALGALDTTELDEVYIVPVGVNFTYADRLQSDVMINCGEPIKASAYLKDYQENATPAINELTEELRKRLSEEVIIIDKIEDEPLVENILRLYRTEHPQPAGKFLRPSQEQLRGEKRISEAINTLQDHEKQALTRDTHDYFSRLERMQIDDPAFRGHYRKEQQQTGRIFLSVLPVLLLLIWHLPPVLLVQWLAGTKIKTVEFSGPVRWAGLMVVYLIYILLWLIAALVIGSWWPVVIAGVGFLSASWIIRFTERSHRWLLGWRAKRQTEHEMKYLKKLRAQIIEQVRGFWA
ncbi:1-acyl-sn-glycerol-3-phosphate acyltransferase [Lewinella sp. LCG006]|uniref:1-acyl-sn-glycerol-3-phosphate acyltransferase n=1 Tax=Lewinella sp. LCG006 TaxID=3231911 RepID=UPI00345F8EAE